MNNIKANILRKTNPKIESFTLQIIINVINTLYTTTLIFDSMFLKFARSVKNRNIMK